MQYDFWSCRSSGKQFGALIAHVPIASSNKQHILLGLVPLSKSHTADNIANWAKEVLGMFEISLGQRAVSPVVSIATIDMAANGRAAAQRLGLLYMPMLRASTQSCSSARNYSSRRSKTTADKSLSADKIVTKVTNSFRKAAGIGLRANTLSGSRLCIKAVETRA
jgi:hypothetical protein